ncbi:alanine--tRNA ligase [Paratissierella segnis]|uniref:Alanine--tRNA ligase n=1 Tax=Paratissierella segnis TaxID=2763679 RepID=A0A926EUG6_9FIRM|nr:alanine--tRNA ligase [Paratissierella segnis]MBC8588473.1 alanine--tRNA ligase [Paratissierella segnis]
MKKIGLHEIRKEFLDFFEEKGHLVAPSFSLVPKNDKSLLLIGAGMAPLKHYFTGEAIPPRNRMATCQKCIRTGDIDNVGKTARHATFFEMLGNFSFGDYFKKEAISWAWEFLTERMEIDPLDLWVTVYKDDDEAFELWNKMIGLPEEKIVRLGKDDNFWELEVGPSGPCSEIYVDRGIEYGCGDENCKPGCECDRFLEIWNLVFTQFDKDENGVYHPLPNPNIDTGMGLERMATVMEGTNNIFEIGAIRSILRKVEEISKYNYGSDEEKDVSVRVITDHARAMTFLVSDGVLPSNEGRGYVLRRLIRRASRHGKLLGINGGFLSEVVDVVINSWQIEYKDLKEKDKEIKKVIQAEEAKFQETIDQGISILEDYINEMRKKKKSVLSGEKAFKLYDTYGFPLDLTKEILLEKNLSLNEEEFKLNMERQRRRARNSRDSGDSGWGGKESKELFKDINSTFKGYETVKLETEIISLIKDNTKVNELSRFEEGVVILKETPFYGESGGQVGDKGKISGDNFTLEVLDTKLYDDLRLHNVKVVEGEVKLGDKVTASVDVLRRDAIRRNHSATHLLHKALKEVLGEHVNQAGSYVTPDRLRFDFTHFESITPNDLKKVEDRVNEMIFKGLDVETIETTLDEAYKLGAIGLFEEKYKNDVRIVKMGNYSQELCGGTHVVNTSNIGLFKIISETSIASGFRRIEAITGLSVLNFLNSIERELDELSNILKTNNTNIIEKATQIVEDIKERDKEIEKLKGKLSSNIADEIIDSKKEVKDIQYIVYKLKDMDMNSLRNLGDEIRNRLGSGVVVLASVLNDKISYVVMVTKDINKKGILAGNIIKEIAKVSGGNGGGRADMAQAGGKDISKVDESLLIVEGLIEKQMNN